MRVVVVTACDVRGASGVKAAVGLSHCAEHNGCALWSTVVAMSDDVSALPRAARLQCLQRKPLLCNAHASRLQARSADWGFFLMLCYRQLTVSVSLNFMLCSAVLLRLLAFVLLVVIFGGINLLFYWFPVFALVDGEIFSIVTTNSCHY